MEYTSHMLSEEAVVCGGNKEASFVLEVVAIAVVPFGPVCQDTSASASRPGVGEK